MAGQLPPPLARGLHPLPGCAVHTACCNSQRSPARVGLWDLRGSGGVREQGGRAVLPGNLGPHFTARRGPHGHGRGPTAPRASRLRPRKVEGLTRTAQPGTGVGVLQPPRRRSQGTDLLRDLVPSCAVASPPPLASWIPSRQNGPDGDAHPRPHPPAPQRDQLGLGLKQLPWTARGFPLGSFESAAAARPLSPLVVGGAGSPPPAPRTPAPRGRHAEPTRST